MADVVVEPAQGAGAGANPAANPAPVGDTMVPKYRFDEVNKRCQEAEAKAVELQKAAEAAKAKDDRIAALEKELADTKSGYELEKASTKRQQAIEAAIGDRAVDKEVIQKLLDLEKISIDDKGTVKGLDEQLKALQTSKPYLWKAAKPVVKPGDKGPAKTEKSFAQKMAENKKAQMGVTAKSKTYF